MEVACVRRGSVVVELGERLACGLAAFAEVEQVHDLDAAVRADLWKASAPASMNDRRCGRLMPMIEAAWFGVSS